MDTYKVMIKAKSGQFRCYATKFNRKDADLVARMLVDRGETVKIVYKKGK